ncbi:ras-related protein rab7 [Spinachia spinachia]
MNRYVNHCFTDRLPLHPGKSSWCRSIVLGNKTDLSSREVSIRKARRWCEQIGAEYLEGSAKEPVDVEKPLLRAARSFAARKKDAYKKHTLENTGHFQIICKEPRETRNTCEC